MKEIKGDMFKIYKEYDAICITTNGKTKVNNNIKKAIMGAGVAKACRDKFYGSDEWLAKKLKQNGNITQIFGEANGVSIIAFPTKNDWRDASDIDLIIKSAEQLRELIFKLGWDKVLLPQPGCTNGGLDWNYVKCMIEPILPESVTIISL